MCGLFGFSGDPKVMNMTMSRMVQAKIKILGIYNIDRGKHSCGVFMNDLVLKGVNEDKVFSDFIQNNEFPDAVDSGNYTIIGHTRAATHGAHTEANAHPFIVNDDFVLAHNGVIRNIDELCKQYGINNKDLAVDSHALAHLIHQEGFSILNEYKGFAALLMSSRSEPNTLWMYRGVSKRYKLGTEDEERPLYYMHSEEGIYVSSIEKSLLAISDSLSGEVKQVEGNLVHKITNGKMTKTKIPIDRSEVNYGVYATTHSTYTAPKTTGGDTQKSISNGKLPFGEATTPTSTSTDTNAGSVCSFDKEIAPLLWFETLPDSKFDSNLNCDFVFFHQGRYWVAINDELNLAHGAYYVSKKGRIHSERTRGKVNCYFYEGAMMKSKTAYEEACKDSCLKSVDYNIAMFLSKYACHPVTNCKGDVISKCKGVTSYNKHRWYQDFVMCKSTGFTPRFSDRNYTIREGLLHHIEMQKDFRGKAEKCIDVEAMIAARKTSAKEAYQAAKEQAPVIPIHQQAGLPSLIKRDEPVLSTGQTVSEYSCVNFYRPFIDVEEARSTLTMDEINAIRYYIADIMMQEMEVVVETIFDENVDVQVDLFLTACIENGQSLYDQWDTKGYNDIETYLMLAKENPNGEYSPETDVIEDEDDFHEEDVEETYATTDPPPFDVKDREAMYLPPVNLHSVAIRHEEEDEVIQAMRNQNDDEKQTKILEMDEIIAREEAAVPQDSERLEIEEVSISDAIEYDVKDTADYLITIRDCADSLQTYDHDDFAQDVAAELYKTVDSLIHKLNDICRLHDKEEIGKYISQLIKTKVSL